MVNMFINHIPTEEWSHYPERGIKALLDWYFKKALPCAMRSMDWRQKRGKYTVSELVSAGDEAMVLTMLENSWNQWHAMYWQGMDSTDERLPTTKYTGKGAYSGRIKVPIGGRQNTGKGMRSEWNMEGVDAYNTNYAWVVSRREKGWAKIYEEGVRAEFDLIANGGGGSDTSCGGVSLKSVLKVMPVDELGVVAVDELGD
jgi:hypothetical protein